MTRLTSVILILLICATATGQSRKSIELSFTGRYDRHANYVSNFAGRVYNDINKLYGYSYGVSGLFRYGISKTVSVYGGLGYYQLRIDKIKGSMPFNIPGTRTGRNIAYDDGMTNLLYSTSQYHYNNLAVTIGADKDMRIGKNAWFTVGPELAGYYSFSQKYRLFEDRYTTTHNDKPLEFGANINAGIVKNYGTFYLRPSLLIPVYQNLKGDKMFTEDPDRNISKWFHGIGLSLKIGKRL